MVLEAAIVGRLFVTMQAEVKILLSFLNFDASTFLQSIGPFKPAREPALCLVHHTKFLEDQAMELTICCYHHLLSFAPGMQPELALPGWF